MINIGVTKDWNLFKKLFFMSHELPFKELIQNIAHLCHIKACFPVDGGAAANDDEEHGADHLGNQGTGELPPAVWHQRILGGHL